VTVAEVVLTRIVRSVGEPEADDRRADLLRDLHALAAVRERLRAHLRVGMTQAPEPVRVVSEQIRIDRADPDAALAGVVAERGPVVDAVPRDVQRHRRARAGEAVDERGVVDPLVDGAGRAGPGVDVEAGSGVPVAPRRRLDLEGGQTLEGGVLGHGCECDASTTRFSNRLTVRPVS
jgi:hypothetical protein